MISARGIGAMLIENNAVELTNVVIESAVIIGTDRYYQHVGDIFSRRHAYASKYH